MEEQRLLPLEEALLGIQGGPNQLRLQIGVKGGLEVLPCPDVQSEIVRHSKNPSPWVLDFFALLECGVQTQKYLLGPLLRLRGVKPKAQQVTIYILARLQK